MKIKIQGFLYQMHSWSKVNYSIGETLIKLGHDVHFVPTDADKKCHFPENLKQYLHKTPEGQYDCQIGYTAFLNAPIYFQNGNKNRFLIWAFEYAGKNVLPQGFAKYYKYVDKILAPSNFCKKIFEDSGIPKENIVVIPHGIDLNESKNIYPLKTNKKYKIGMIIGQPHKRKNIASALKAYGQAFNKKDDVCLVAKVAADNNVKGAQFEINFREVLKNFKIDFPNHAEIEVITDYVENINEIYNACDAIFTMSHCEGFYMVGLEALNANKLNIAPRHGGQLDFLNDNNSLLINTEIVRAPHDHIYWQGSPYAEMGKPSIEHASQLLKQSYEQYDELINKFKQNMIETANKYTWKNVCGQILENCKI